MQFNVHIYNADMDANKFVTIAKLISAITFLPTFNYSNENVIT